MAELFGETVHAYEVLVVRWTLILVGIRQLPRAMENYTKRWRLNLAHFLGYFGKNGPYFEHCIIQLGTFVFLSLNLSERVLKELLT